MKIFAILVDGYVEKITVGMVHPEIQIVEITDERVNIGDLFDGKSFISRESNQTFHSQSTNDKRD